jgi:hypothetical protein
MIGALVVILSRAPEVSGCSVGQGSQPNVKWVGGQQTPSVTPYAARATIDAYNPSPVYDVTSIWIMLVGNPQYAQVGWRKDVGATTESVYDEYQDNSGHPWIDFHNTPQGTNETYKVTFAGSGYQFCWNEGCSWNTHPATWVPGTVENFGEIQNYIYYNPPPSAGDHSPGDVFYAVNSVSVGWQNSSGVWYNANLSSWRADADYQERYIWDGHDWQTWDSRCGN